jgi:hypothetical protein
VQQTQQVLEKADVEWSDISTALDELAHAIESLEPHQPMRDVSRQLLSISVRCACVFVCMGTLVCIIMVLTCATCFTGWDIL